VTSSRPDQTAAAARPNVQGGEPGTLSRELADFLVELSIALHKNAIYPEGHPLLAGAVTGVLRRLVPLLRDRDTLSLGVARHQLVIEGVATNESNPLLAELAARLHRHHLGAVRFQSGVGEAEIGDFLRTVAEDAGRSGRPLGLEPPDAIARWANVRLFPMTFSQLELLDGGPSPEEASRRAPGAMGGGSRAAQLWVGLARAALAGDAPAATDADGDAPLATDPAAVAQAIDEHGRDQAYDQVVVGYLLQIAQELRSRQGRDALQLRKRISQLVASLRPETLRRLLEMGGDVTQRRRFVLDATAEMAVEAVVDVVEAAADTSHQTISHSMMRLLSKFAAHAEGGTAPVRPEADGALRDHVKQLLSEWKLDDPNPDAYRRTLEGMSHAPAVLETSEHSYPPEPERIVQMALETGAVGEALWRAVDILAARPDFGALLDLAAQGPAGNVRDAILGRVAVPERLHALLAQRPLPLALLERLTSRMGLAAAEPLLDALEDADERDVPGLLSALASLGDEIVPALGRRLEGARWTAMRRLVALVGRLPEMPAGFSALPLLRHPDDGVRREALKVALRGPERDLAIETALLDPDERVIRGALAAAIGGCTHGALATVMRRMDELGLPTELRELGVRVVGTRGDEGTVPWLVRQAAERSGVLRRPRLRPASPEVVAAVEALAARWRDEEQAAGLLRLAARSDDEALRRAASPRRESTIVRAAIAASDEPVPAIDLPEGRAT
jgi:hypothetical protein